jgi:hypothetical protein
LTTVSPMIFDAGPTPYMATDFLLVSFISYSLLFGLLGSILPPTASKVFASHGIIIVVGFPLLHDLKGKVYARQIKRSRIFH